MAILPSIDLKNNDSNQPIQPTYYGGTMQRVQLFFLEKLGELGTGRHPAMSPAFCHHTTRGRAGVRANLLTTGSRRQLIWTGTFPTTEHGRLPPDAELLVLSGGRGGALSHCACGTRHI